MTLQEYHLGGEKPPQRMLAHLLCGLLLLMVAAAAGFGCGEATDSPEDCRPGEYFDEANERCTACPAVTEPECEPGCGFRITSDERGCPATECAEQCLCPSEEFFSADTLACEDCATAADPPAICFEGDQQQDE